MAGRSEGSASATRNAWFILLAVSLWYFLPLFATWLAPRIARRFFGVDLKIRKWGWRGVHGIQWSTSQSTSTSASASRFPIRLQHVCIESIQIVIRNNAPKDDDTTCIGWIGLSVNGVRVQLDVLDALSGSESISGVHSGDKLHSGFSADSASSPRDIAGAQSTSIWTVLRCPIKATWRALRQLYTVLRLLWRFMFAHVLPANYHKAISRIWRKFRHQVFSPLLARLNRFLRACGNMLALCVLEIAGVQVTVPQAGLSLKLELLRLGGAIIRGRNSHLEAWARLHGLACLYSDSTVLELQSTLLVEVKGYFDHGVGLAGLIYRDSDGRLHPRPASIGIALTFKEATDPISVPSISLDLNTLQGVMHHLSRVLLSHSVSLGNDDKGHMPDDTPAPDHLGFATSAMLALGNLELCIPLIRIVYAMSNSAGAAYQLAGTMSALAFQTSVGPAIVKDAKHSEWFGRNTRAKFVTILGFDKIEVVSSQPSAHKEPSRLIDMAASGLHVSSGWLPSKIEQAFDQVAAAEQRPSSARMRGPMSPHDMPIPHLIVEGDVGGLHIDTDMDLLSVVSQELAARALRKSAAGDVRPPPKATSANHGRIFVHNPPILHVCVELAKSAIHIAGPSIPQRASFGPGSDDAGSSRGWDASSILHFQIPSVSLHVNSRSIESSLRRTVTERQKLRDSYHRGKYSIPENLVSWMPAEWKAFGQKRVWAEHTRQAAAEEETMDVTEEIEGTDLIESNRQVGNYTAPQVPLPAFLGSGHRAGAFSMPVPMSNANAYPFLYNLNVTFAVERLRVFLSSSKRPRKESSRSPSAQQSSDHMSVQPDERHSIKHGEATHEIADLGPTILNIGLDCVGKEAVHPYADNGTHIPILESKCKKDGTVHLSSEIFRMRLSNLDVHHALHGLLALAVTSPGAPPDSNPHLTGSARSESEQVRPEETRTHRTLAKSAPADIMCTFSLNLVDVHLATPDAKFEPNASRGLSVTIDNVKVQVLRQSRARPGLSAAPTRAALSLDEDLRSHANAAGSDQVPSDRAFLQASLNTLSIYPLYRRPGRGGKHSHLHHVAPATSGEQRDWELKNRQFLTPSLPVSRFNIRDRHNMTAESTSRELLAVNSLKSLITIWSEASDGNASIVRDCFSISMEAPLVVARIDMFRVYCSLLAYSAWKSHFGQLSRIRPRKPVSPGRLSPRFEMRATLTMTHLYLTLPHDVKLFAQLRQLKIIKQDSEYTVKLDTAIIAGASVASPGMWDDIIRMREWSVGFKKASHVESIADHCLNVDGKGGRVRIPFKFPISIIVDNLATFFKALKQLAHQFVKGRYGSAIEPKPEGPKRIPNIRIALKVLVLEAQDDPFETRLNLIWRAGVEEQLERLTLARAFSERREAILKAKAEKSQGRWSQGDELTSFGNDDPSTASADPTLSLEDAEAVLQSINSTRWIKRHRNALKTRVDREENQLRRLYGPLMRHMSCTDLPISLVPTDSMAPLMRMVLEKPVIELARPHFDNSPTGLVDFLYDVGSGVPRDTQYSLLIPFHLKWQMSEARVHIRDYPLPLLFIPPVQQFGSQAISWECSSDFVINEEMCELDAIRNVACEVVPREASNGTDGLPYVIRVPRTAMPIKTYAEPVIKITSAWATRIVWGNSIQPAIQDIMRVLDSLTKAPPDPSEKLGFWDKIRLVLHWRIAIRLLGDGPLHLIMKGSRDPYSLRGIGAGFALSWSGNIRWRIGHKQSAPSLLLMEPESSEDEDDSHEFFQIRSDSFTLGIPDLGDFVDSAATGVSKAKSNNFDGDSKSQQSGISSDAAHLRTYRRDQSSEKVCARFVNGVKWGLGLAFERTCRDDCCPRTPPCSGDTFQRKCRMFHFKPHYEVKTISGVDAPHDPHHDSYAAFRSDFLHFSISVLADRPGPLANSVYLTPNGFTHFWAWWRLFDGTMSLPVRQGALFPSTQAPSKKFGKHCATIKYRTQLAPVSIAHTYTQDDWDDWHRGRTTVLGIKGRIGTFHVDLHQREQEESVYSEHLDTTRRRRGKAFARAEIDCADMELRTVVARFTDVRKKLVHPGIDQEEEDAAPDPFGLDDAPSVTDEDLAWVDLDDFADITIPLPDMNPAMRITRWLKTHRLTYSRIIPSDGHTAQGTSSDQEKREPVSKFGYEMTHRCLLDAAPDALDVQLELAISRKLELEKRLESYQHSSSQTSLHEASHISRQLNAIQGVVQRLQTYKSRRHSVNSQASTNNHSHDYRDILQDSTAYEDMQSWTNRLLLHNPNCMVTPEIRDVLMRYYYSSRQRRLAICERPSTPHFTRTESSIDALTSRAIKFIRDLAKEAYHGSPNGRPYAPRDPSDQKQERGHDKDGSPKTTHAEQADLIEKLFKEGESNGDWQFQDCEQLESDMQSPSASFNLDPEMEDSRDLPEHWASKNNFIVTLLKPQIAFNTDASESSTIILTMMSVQLKILAVVDQEHLDDPINSHVMYRSFGSLTSLQAFYPHLHGWRSGRREEILHSLQFVPMEVLTGSSIDPVDLDRIVPQTSARLRYDKHNRLRLLNDGKRSKSGGSPLLSTVDRLKVVCDRFSVSATPKHYNAIYEVVTNIILHTDPGQKLRSQKIERIVLSKDFSNHQDIALSVSRQQEELRVVIERVIELACKGIGNLAEADLLDYYTFGADMIRRLEVLTLWLRAIQTSQDSRPSTQSMGMQLDARASEIVWHMRDKDGTPLIKVGIRDTSFRWLNGSDGSVANFLVIRDLTALNSGPEHYFSEIISKYPTPANASEKVMRSDYFIVTVWSMLSPVGGIPVVERIAIHLHPIRLQLEQSIGKAIMHYLYPQRGTGAKSSAPDSKHSIAQSTHASSSNLSLARAQSIETLSISSTDRSSAFSSISSSSSLASSASSLKPRSLRHVSSTETLSFTPSRGDDYLDAEEMRERARLNRAFIQIEFNPTILCLSFRGGKSTSLPDLYGLIYKSPTIVYCNRLWTYLDLLEHIKRDFKSSIWSQGAGLIGQILTTARKPKNVVQHHMQKRLRSEHSAREGTRRKSLGSTIRARLVSHDMDGGDVAKRSPLRDTVVRQDVEDHHSDEDGSDSSHTDSLEELEHPVSHNTEPGLSHP